MQFEFLSTISKFSHQICWFYYFAASTVAPIILDSNSLPGSKQVSRDDITLFTDFDIPTKAKKPDKTILKKPKPIATESFAIREPDKTICLTTNDSQDKNAECKFPWKYNGKIRNECTNETDPNGK